MNFDNVRRAIAAIGRGEQVILVDDEDRENEGDLCLAADCVTPEAINFMAKYGRGLICLTLTPDRLEALQIPMMVADNSSRFQTAFTVSIEARHGVTTGISAADRARTIQVAVDPESKPRDLARPGHIFPLRAQPGGVLVRTGQTEGSVDLARLAGKSAAGVICEVMNDDGTMARRDDLRRFGEVHGLQTVSIAELIAYRLAHETLVHELGRAVVDHPRYGRGTLYAFGTPLDERQHLAWVRGATASGGGGDGEPSDPAPLVRVEGGTQPHEVLAELRREQDGPFAVTLAQLAQAPAAALVCLQTERTGPSLADQVAQLAVAGGATQRGVPAGEQDGVLRQLGIGAQILRVLGLTRIRLLTGHARKLAGLKGYGLHVDEVVTPASAPSEET